MEHESIRRTARERLEAAGYWLVGDLRISTSKGSVTTEAVAPDGRHVVAKVVGAGSTASAAASLEAETDYYLRWRVPEDPSPRLVGSEPGLLIVERVGSADLRAVLLQVVVSGDSMSLGVVAGAWLSSLRRHYQPILQGPGSLLPPRRFVAGVLHIQRQLLRSGPLAEGRSILDRIIGRAIEPIVTPSTRSIAMDTIANWPQLTISGWSHGDLHCDNVRIDEDGVAWLVDFGQWRPDGLPALDVIYSCATALATLAADPGLQEVLIRKMTAELAQFGDAGQGLRDLSLHLARLAETNRRFTPASGRRSLLEAQAAALITGLRSKIGRRTPVV